MKAHIRGTEIYYDIAGMQLAPVGNTFEERPVVFMLHGGPGGDHTRFKQHSLEIQEVAQVVFIDHRGCGRSKKGKQKEYTLENNIEDIEALRKHLGLDKISMIGTSYGGIVAQGYALRYHKHIDKLVLVVTAPSYRFLEEAKKILEKRGTNKQKAMCEFLWNGCFKNPRHVTNFFKIMDSLYSNMAKKKKTAVFAKLKTQWSHEALNEGFGGFLKKFDFISKLKNIKCKTLVIAGEDDWICPPSQSRIIAKEIPKATLKIFKNAGHAVAVDAHAGYIKEIKRFLKNK